MLGSAGSAGSAGVESPDDADEPTRLARLCMRSTGLLREPGDAVASGDVAKAPLWREPLWAGAARALPAWFLI